MTEVAQAATAAAANMNALPLFPALAVPPPPKQESEVAGAIRRAFLKLLEEPLTPNRAQKLARAAGTSIKFLRAIEPDTADNLLGTIRKSPGPPIYSPYGGAPQEEWEQDADDSAGPMAYSPNSETFSSSAVSQFLSALPKLLGASRRSPEQMVSAIVEAKRAGLHKLAADLTKQLGIEDKAVLDEMPSPEEEESVTAICTHPGADDGSGKCPKCVELGLANPELPSRLDFEARRKLKPTESPRLGVNERLVIDGAMIPPSIGHHATDDGAMIPPSIGHHATAKAFGPELGHHASSAIDPTAVKFTDPVRYPDDPTGPSSHGGCGLD